MTEKDAVTDEGSKVTDKATLKAFMAIRWTYMFSIIWDYLMVTLPPIMGKYDIWTFDIENIALKGLKVISH